MKYCVNYRRDLKCRTEVDELRITYRKEDTTLFDFLRLYKDKRINIVIPDAEDFIACNEIKKFIAFEEERIANNHNYVFVLLSCEDSHCQDLYTIIRNEIGVEIYFNDRINNWDTLIGLVNKYEISDVYITEDLGFELPFVRNFLSPYGIRIRCFANVAQSQWEETPIFKKFFIRPEDVDVYEDYIDVLEFYYERIDQQNVLYRVYSKEKKWSGKLAEIIFSCEEDVDNRCILPEFAEKRLSCSKKCYRGGKCLFCHRALSLAKTMADAELRFVQTEKEEDNFKIDF